MFLVEQAEQLSEISNLKKLKGSTDYYRMRVGDYRIGIKVNDGVVSFVRILHRKEIYRYFP
ncbi:type II toxin-antitoxin system RelE/ParE family toxin [[Phormidium] sp. ETS-05]|uniref:type II toxin-antitoxin system RelE/ParE family toxin n=1 Tax=[Phormidium] sp. ETS-05 TaxID=222819 RepID=UPI0018EF0D21